MRPHVGCVCVRRFSLGGEEAMDVSLGSAEDGRGREEEEVGRGSPDEGLGRPDRLKGTGGMRLSA